MTFDAIHEGIKTYETDAEASVVGAQLQKLIAKHGLDILKNLDLLREEIQKTELPNVKKEQLILVFSCSTVPDFAANARSDLNLVDVDNIVHNVIATTGLSYGTTISLVTDILYACGMHFSVEYGPVLFEQSVDYRLHALMPSTVAAAEVKKTRELFDSFQRKYFNAAESPAREADAAKVIGAIQKLCAAGISDGFYLLARCYLYGACDTAVDHSRGLQYMKIAAEQGNNEAAAQLGDAYYNCDSALERNYTLAHYYYTRPGALALGPSGRSALEDIYEQKKCNVTTLIFSAIVFALTIAFVTFFHEGIFSGASRLAIGVIAIVLSLAAVVLTTLYHIRAKFNGIRWLIAIQFFVFALYAFILVLA